MFSSLLGEQVFAGREAHHLRLIDSKFTGSRCTAMLVRPGMDRIDKCLINALGDDALGAKPASVCENDRAILVFVERDAGLGIT